MVLIWMEFGKINLLHHSFLLLEKVVYLFWEQHETKENFWSKLSDMILGQPDDWWVLRLLFTVVVVVGGVSIG